MAKGAIANFVLALLIDERVAHFERRENATVKEFAVGYSGSICDDYAQDNVAGIAVFPARAGSELADGLRFQQRQNLVVLNLMFRAPLRPAVFLFLFHDFRVIRQAGSMVQ